jgi:hypothetical protein
VPQGTRGVQPLRPGEFSTFCCSSDLSFCEYTFGSDEMCTSCLAAPRRHLMVPDTAVRRGLGQLQGL